MPAQSRTGAKRAKERSATKAPAYAVGRQVGWVDQRRVDQVVEVLQLLDRTVGAPTGGGASRETPRDLAKCHAKVAVLSRPLIRFYLDDRTRRPQWLLVDNECKVNDWLDLLDRRNRSKSGLWIARFLIERPWTIALIADELRSIDGTIIGSDPADEYIVTFPAQLARTALGIVAEHSGWLCEQQTPATTE